MSEPRFDELLRQPCALEDLKAMKRAAGRMRDLADLEDLEATS